MNEEIHIFDRGLVRRHRDRAAGAFAPRHSALREETAEQLAERIKDVKRDFKTILDLGAPPGTPARRLAADGGFAVAADLSEKMLKQGGVAPSVAADEEFLPFAPESFDLIVSNLGLHWVNDLPGALAQIRQALKPDGLFLAALLGGRTLFELRACLLEAELAARGGASPRLSPNLDMPTASALMQRAGFSLPVTDHEIVTFAYPDIFALMRDLRGMGEANAHQQRSRNMTGRKVFAEADRLYRERFSRADGRIAATFEVIFVHGWR
jgi:NADH dehydrogenase [ubiquinone] 1 alpha subcomplex assembly factor 5